MYMDFTSDYSRSGNTVQYKLQWPFQRNHLLCMECGADQCIVQNQSCTLEQGKTQSVF
jgi:hypothetical protein